MKRIYAVVLVLDRVVRDAVDFKSAVLDAVGVAALQRQRVSQPGKQKTEPKRNGWDGWPMGELDTGDGSQIPIANVFSRKNSSNDAIGELMQLLTGNTAQMRVQLVDAVVACIVEAEYNVAFDAVGVIQEEVGDGGAIGDKVGANALC